MTDDRKGKTGGEVEFTLRVRQLNSALAESRAEVAELRESWSNARDVATRAEARAERLAGALREVDEYLAEREDVIDGDYGQPEASDEMRLRQVVSAALNLEPRND